MKQVIIFCLAMTLMLFSAYGQEFYTSFEVSGTQGIPEEVFVSGEECDNSQCSDTTQRKIEVYSGEATTCLQQGKNGELTIDEFNACMSDFKIDNNVVSTQNNDKIVTKSQVPSDFGYLTYFSASNDQYLPYRVEQNNFNCNSNLDICIENDDFPISFEKKDGAIAEIGQVNIRNTDDKSKPIQIEVPVEIEQTVCSAYTRVLDNAWEPNIPDGFSDFNADTVVNLQITSNEDDSLLHSDSVFLPIEADNCVDFTSFDWTPDSNLEDEEVTISLTTQVTDNQVINAKEDKAEVIETVFPDNLDNTCWTRIEDYTLTNNPQEELSSSLAQISQGESLFASINTGGYENEAVEPIPHLLELRIDGITLYSQTLSTPQEGLNSQNINLTQAISGLSPGDYEVTAITTPQSNSCESIEQTTHTQQLTIQENMRYDLEVTVKNESLDFLENSEVELELLEASENFEDEQSFLETKITNESGVVMFNDILAGDYRYSIEKQGYATKNDEIAIGSDSTLHVTLNKENKAPIVNLPSSFNSRVGEEVEIDLTQYIRDPNENFQNLDISSQIISGTGDVASEEQGEILTVNSSIEGDVQVEVTAEDSQGLTAQDTTTIEFTQNQPPVINSFTANPDNGETPFNTQFSIDVEDADNDPLTCTLTFGDVSPEITRDCNTINTISHTYNDAGTYTAQLEVSDSTFETQEELSIVAFSNTSNNNQAPVINLLEESTALVDENVTINLRNHISDDNDNFSDLELSSDVTTNRGSASIENGIVTITSSNQGEVEVTITVEDTQGLTAEDTTKVFFSQNQPPVINSFTASPLTGNIPFTTTFSIDVDDVDTQTLTCTLIFDDSTPDITRNCDDLNTISHTYINSGAYNPTLEVSDSEFVVSEQLTLLAQDQAPVINSFTANPQTGTVPFTTTFLLNVSDPESQMLNCTLDFDDSTPDITRNCSNVTSINHTYTNANTYNPRLSVSDSQTVVSQQISLVALENNSIPENDSGLEENDVELLIDNTITPGEFSFSIKVINETLQKRDLFFKPEIQCSLGVTSKIENVDGELSTRAISSVTRGDSFVYDLNLDTQDFTTTIPKDENCEFKVKITDKHNTQINTSQNVVFSYPEEEQKITSIRGEVTDILSYVDIALQDSQGGYNSKTFRLINNDDEGREITISLSSRELNLNEKITENLGPSSQRDIAMSYFIDEEKSGLYPVRISINDGEEHQTRYSYITIGE